MKFDIEEKHDFKLNAARVKDLVSAVKQAHPHKEGIVLLFAGFEEEALPFRQESSFFYMTGLQEPGIVLMVDLQGISTIYKPNCDKAREQWMFSHVALTQENAKNIGIDAIKPLGSTCASYQFHPFFPQTEYEYLLQELKSVIENNQSIFTLNPSNSWQYTQSRFLLMRLEKFLPGLMNQVVDISPLIAQQRRRKDMSEINNMMYACELTALAHETAAHAIKPDIFESEVQAGLEYIFTAAGGRAAFPSIVATGKNATILHYTMNHDVLKNGDLVVVDIGAQYNGYCADLTRTYPVSGTFTKRQRELYALVLATQEYIASIAKPGYWLNNPDQPEKSLQHLAKKFMADRGGYDKYFVHGIGHFLGLDVHDVGDIKKPLEAGDVITIEPGIYIAAENIGIRIEDDYWVTRDGVMCLSESLPKKIEDIEAFMIENDEEFLEDEFDFDQDDENITVA